MGGVDIVREFPDTTWATDGPTRSVESTVEDGKVLSFPQLPFTLAQAEKKFLHERWADGHANATSLFLCLELSATYEPPYALRVTREIFGTVAWQYA